MAESDLIRGNVDTIILRILYEGDRYAYDIIKRINERLDGQWSIKQATVYACLKRMEKRKFISSYWDDSESEGGRRKYYTLTETGKEVFARYKSEYDHANRVFGGIINDADPVLQADDDYYSDVEDEGYATPKRPSKPRPRPKKIEQPAQQTVIEQPVQQAVAEQPTQQAVTEQPVQQATEQPVQQAVTEQPVQQTVIEQPVQQAVIEQPVKQVAQAEARDPREILQSIFAAESGASYDDARKKGEPMPVLSERKADTAVAPVSAKPVPAPAPAPVPPSAPSPVAEEKAVLPSPAPDGGSVGSYHTAEVPTPPASDDESEARRMYKSIIDGLIKESETAPPVIRDEPAEEDIEETVDDVAASAAEAEEASPRVSRSLGKLGNKIRIRTPNDSAKEFSDKNYYFGNRLTLTKYIAMCSSMLATAFVVFLILYVTFDIRMKYDYLLYTAAGLLPIIMFLFAVLAYWKDPDKRKRVNPNYTFSIITRIVIMIQVAVVIYCLNIIMGMPVGFSAEYLPTLLIPLCYALFIPISEIADMYLVRSKRYADTEYNR